MCLDRIGVVKKLTIFTLCAATLFAGTTALRDEPRIERSGLARPLLRAFRHAKADARAEGVRLRIRSGYRTEEEQRALWVQALEDYGSEAEARTWVLPPGESRHELGLAIDVGPREGIDWLGSNGAGHGLCRTMAWEPWHFEWIPRARTDGVCPEPAARP